MRASAAKGDAMTRCRDRWVATAAALAFALAPAAAAAHEFWLSPSAYGAVPGDTVSVRACVGTGFCGEIKAYAPARVLRFELRGARTVDLAPAGAGGETRWARFVAADAGGQVVAYESNAAFIELEAARFDAYLEEEGLDEVLAARRDGEGGRDPGRERYARCAKTWVAGDRPERVLQPAGLMLEIVPLEDPGPAEALRVRVLFRGAPLAGARVRGWNRPLARGAAPIDPEAADPMPPAVQTRTDADGVAVLDVRRPGEWLLNTVHMVPCSEPAAADWQSWWASFSFAKR
jgi:hypothetical protein